MIIVTGIAIVERFLVRFRAKIIVVIVEQYSELGVGGVGELPNFDDDTIPHFREWIMMNWCEGSVQEYLIEGSECNSCC